MLNKACLTQVSISFFLCAVLGIHALEMGQLHLKPGQKFKIELQDINWDYSKKFDKEAFHVLERYFKDTFPRVEFVEDAEIFPDKALGTHTVIAKSEFLMPQSDLLYGSYVYNITNPDVSGKSFDVVTNKKYPDLLNENGRVADEKAAKEIANRVCENMGYKLDTRFAPVFVVSQHPHLYIACSASEASGGQGSTKQKQEKAKLSQEQKFSLDLYGLLGLKPTANNHEIQRAFDRAKQEAVSKNNTLLLERARIAIAVLTDPAQRQLYDKIYNQRISEKKQAARQAVMKQHPPASSPAPLAEVIKTQKIQVVAPEKTLEKEELYKVLTNGTSENYYLFYDRQRDSFIAVPNKWTFKLPNNIQFGVTTDLKSTTIFTPAMLANFRDRDRIVYDGYSITPQQDVAEWYITKIDENNWPIHIKIPTKFGIKINTTGELIAVPLVIYKNYQSPAVIGDILSSRGYNAQAIGRLISAKEVPQDILESLDKREEFGKSMCRSIGAPLFPDSTKLSRDKNRLIAFCLLQ